MVSTYTTNKSLEKPGNGDYVDTWNVPANGDFDIIDQAFGGVTSLNATAGSATLTSTQYRSLILSVSGAMSASVVYTIPSGIGGEWIVRNTTTDSVGGPWTVTIESAGGGTSVVLARSTNTIIWSDGTNIRTAGVTSVDVSGGSTGLTTSGGPITGSGTITVAGTLNVANGGTGATTLTANNVLLGNGTSAPQTVAPGTSGNVLTSDGTTWVSQAITIPGGFSNWQVFTSGGTFTIPVGITKVKVTVVGGGGGGTASGGNSGAGGGGGAAIKIISGLTPGGTVAVTVGAGGAAGSDGGTSSFGAYCSATGGKCTGNQNGGPGGIGSGGDLNIAGQGGNGGALVGSRGYYGGGGSSILGGGGNGNVDGGGGAGGAYGGGGGSQQAGASGVVIVEY